MRYCRQTIQGNSDRRLIADKTRLRIAHVPYAGLYCPLSATSALEGRCVNNVNEKAAYSTWLQKH